MIEQRPAQPRGQRAERAREGLGRVLGIAGEQLVAALAGQHHGHGLARQLRHQVGGDRGRLRDRLVLVPHQARQLAQQVVGAHHDLVVIGVQVLGDAARERQLVVGGPGFAGRARSCHGPAPGVEAHREGLDRALEQVGHDAHHQARVHAPREQGAERHLAHEPQAHALGEARLDLGERVAVRDPQLGLPRHLPVAARARGAGLHRERVGGLELLDALEQGGGGGRVAQRQVLDHALGPRGARQPREGEQRLDLGGAHEGAPDARVVEGLDAEPVAAHQQPAARAVPEREREHAAQALHTCLAPFLVGMHDALGVAAGAVAMAASFELAAQVGVVVDLAVVGDPHRAVLVRERLGAGGDVHDREPAERQPHPRLDVEPGIIRAAVGERLGRRGEPVGIGGAAVGIEPGREAAHQREVPLTRSPRAAARARAGRRARRRGRPPRRRSSARSSRTRPTPRTSPTPGTGRRCCAGSRS